MENTAVIWELGRTPRPSAGRRRSPKQSFKKRTNRINDYGFLRHPFQPVWLYEGEQVVMEREYFRSLSNLCKYYNIVQPSVTGIPFPQSIYQSWREVAERLENRKEGLTCMIVNDNKKQSVLAVAKPFGLSNDLFYIPVRAFWKWHNCADQQPISQLVLIMFAYLHQVVQIPFYQETGSFMYNQYESLYQWLMEAEDDDDEESKAYRDHREDTLYELSQAGIHIMRLIQDPVWMNKIESIVFDYIPQDEAGQEFSDLANEFLKLYKDHPKATLFDNTYPELLYPEEQERLTPDQYAGFYWSGKDCFADELDDMISCTFQEMAVMDEPVALHLFDEMPGSKFYDFNFESRLFALMERLRDLLNDYDHEEYNGTI